MKKVIVKEFREGKEKDHDIPNIVCCDFDGTLVDYKYGFATKNKIGRPIIEIVGLLDKLKLEGWFIIIFTCRLPEQIEPWLKDNNIPYDSININPWQDSTKQNIGKPFSSVYIDDRAINPFDGDVVDKGLYNKIIDLKNRLDKKYSIMEDK